MLESALPAAVEVMAPAAAAEHGGVQAVPLTMVHWLVASRMMTSITHWQTAPQTRVAGGADAVAAAAARVVQATPPLVPRGSKQWEVVVMRAAGDEASAVVAATMRVVVVVVMHPSAATLPAAAGCHASLQQQARRLGSPRLARSGP
jgi:hypothetical protein